MTILAEALRHEPSSQAKEQHHADKEDGCYPDEVLPVFEAVHY
jgi:hypothetical protein